MSVHIYTIFLIVLRIETFVYIYTQCQVDRDEAPSPDEDGETTKRARRWNWWFCEGVWCSESQWRKSCCKTIKHAHGSFGMIQVTREKTLVHPYDRTYYWVLNLFTSGFLKLFNRMSAFVLDRDQIADQMEKIAVKEPGMGRGMSEPTWNFG